MNELQVIDSVERYLNGEMSAEERSAFEQQRQSNPEMDQMVVEHLFFLQQLNEHKHIHNFKHSLHEVESDLSDKGIFTKSPFKGTAKVVYLWQRYKRNIAVAASIAGFISIFSVALMATFTKKQVDSSITDLYSYVNYKTDKIKTANATSNSTQTVTPKVDYRATGFLIDKKVYLITNAHVVERMKNIYVQNSKGALFAAVTVYTDKNLDLAVLKINDSTYNDEGIYIPYSFKKSSSDLGEQIFTMGFPKNEIVYGEGYLSSKSGNDGDSTEYQLTISANPGNSGGPVVNKNGEIIGVITSKDSKADGVVYAAKAKNIFKVIDELKQSDSAARNIKISSYSTLKGLDRVQQVKKMEDYVFMIVGN